jgi:hypothetical protein
MIPHPNRKPDGLFYDCEGCGDVVQAFGITARPSHAMCVRCAAAQGFALDAALMMETTRPRGWIRGKPPQLRRELRRMAATTPAG